MPEAPTDQPPASAVCAFCRIIRGEEQASVVFEDGLSLAFLDHRPLFPGHCLLVPKGHYETLADLPAPLIGLLFQNAQLLERAIEEGFGADGTFIAINNHISQSVPHLHIHPRRLVTAKMGSRGDSCSSMSYEILCIGFPPCLAVCLHSPEAGMRSLFVSLSLEEPPKTGHFASLCSSLEIPT